MKWGNRGGCALLVLVLIFSFWLVLEEGEAMSGIGYPDWGKIKKGVGVSPLADLGELAARLGSINTFDRRGDTVWMDDFEHTLNKWEVVLFGTGAAGAVSNNAARNGEYSAALTTGTGADPTVYLIHHFFVPVPGKVGVEFSFSSGSWPSYVNLFLDLYDGVYHWSPNFRYNKVNSKLQVQDRTAGYVDVATSLVLKADSYHFHTAKLVVDMATGDYVRLLLNGVEYDISAYAMPRISDTSTPEATVAVVPEGNGTNSRIIYVDDVIITQNEP